MSQDVASRVVDLVKQKGFYSSDYKSDFGKFKEELSTKGMSYGFLTSEEKSW